MKLNKTDFYSLGKGLIIALIGAGLTYLTGFVVKTDFGPYTPLIVTFWSLVANVVRKYIDAPVKDLTGKKI